MNAPRHLLPLLILALFGGLLVSCAAATGPLLPPKQEGKALYADLVTSEGAITVRLLEDDTPVTVSNFVGLATGKKEWTTPDGKKVRKPFYDGLIFHRVISNFMLQGGCPKGDGTGGPGYAFQDEVGKPTPVEGPITNEILTFSVWQRYILPYIAKHKDDANPEVKRLYDTVLREQKGTALMGRSVDDIRKLTGDTNRYAYPVLIAPVAYGTLCMANSGPNSNGSQFFIVTKTDGCDWLNGKHTVFGVVTKGMDIAHRIESVPKNGSDKPLTPVVIKAVKVYRAAAPKG